MKTTKTIALIVCVILVAAILFAVGLGYKENARKVADDGLYSDNGYIDYAKEVRYDYDKYPDLEEQGLFWTVWDSAAENMVLKHADTPEGAALVDPAKPTIIMVHGMLSDGHYNPERFYLNGKIADPEKFGLDTSDVPLGLVWQNAGWNVGFYNYNRFAAEDARPWDIECKIWATDGATNNRYRHLDNTTTDHPSEFSLAEHFAAEYIRAMNLLPRSIGTKEIRFAAHSMGGQLTTASLYLLTELAAHGQLDKDLLPDRFAMLDPYFSTTFMKANGELIGYLGPDKITVRWSGKPIPYGNTGWTMVDCLKVFENLGIAVEYYTFDASTLAVAMPVVMIKEMKKYCVYTVISPEFKQDNPAYNKVTEGHNGVRDWYLCSLYSGPVYNETEGGYAASAGASTETILAFKGKTFVMTGGSDTLTTTDDVFKVVS